MIQTKKDLKEYKNIIKFDINMLESCFLQGNKEDFKYYLKLVKDNTNDLIKDFNIYLER